MGNALRVLLIEDSEDAASLLIGERRRGGFEPVARRVDAAAALTETLRRETWDVITCDYVIPRFSALEALALIRAQQVDAPVMIVSGAVGEEMAVTALRAGAQDYVSKHKLSRLVPAVERALREAEERRARRRAEAALRESEARFASAFEHAPIGMALVAADGRTHRVNRALCQMLGYSEAEFLDSPVWAFTHPDDMAATFDQAAQLFDGNLDTWHLQKRFLHKDGHLVWALSSTSLVRDANGAPLYFISQVQDITERRRTEETLAEEAAVSQAVATASRELIAALDTPTFLNRLCEVTAEVLGCDASHTLLWREEDAAFMPIAGFGATPEEQEMAEVVKVPRRMMTELLGRLTMDDVAQVGTVPRNIPAMTRHPSVGGAPILCMALRRGKELIGIQVAIWRRDHVSFTPTQLRSARGIAGVASMALEHARVVGELERASRLKSDFVATMSHELRTPLNVITGYIDLMLDGVFGALTPEQMQSLQRVVLNARELLDLINATLDLSRLETGRMPITLRDVAPLMLLREVDTETRELQARGSARVVWQLPADLPSLRTDPAKAKVVLKNLITNAVKFTDRGSVTIAARARDGGVECSVSDTGIGIPPEALGVIFEPFHQADSSSTRRHGGVGLGLYIVRRLLDLLGGTISVESEIGRGSTFRVWLPASGQ